MKWLRLASAFILAALAVVITGVFDKLPQPGEGVVAQKQARFSGVLRLWACVGWDSGGLYAWLNAASTRFERSHDGVYVQVTQVSKETLRAFNYAAENPPDMLIFAPGALEGDDDLMQVSATELLRAELKGYAGGRATPVAMGGYAWAVNRRLAPRGDLQGARILVLPDENAYGYSAALIALMAGDEAQTGAPDARYGVDLGLPAPTLAPIAEAAERAEVYPGENSRRDKQAYALFTRGEAEALVVSQREIRKLEALSDAGRAPDYAITHTGYAFTDQLALVSVVSMPRDDADERRRLSAEFIAYLLSDAQQARLNQARAFRVTDGAAIYAGQSGMAALERALMEKRLIAPGAFDLTYRASAQSAAGALLAGEGGAEDRLRYVIDEF